MIENQLQDGHFKYHIEKSGATARENGGARPRPRRCELQD